MDFFFLFFFMFCVTQTLETHIDRQSVRESYNDVRSDFTETNWYSILKIIIIIFFFFSFRFKFTLGGFLSFVWLLSTACHCFRSNVFGCLVYSFRLGVHMSLLFLTPLEFAESHPKYVDSNGKGSSCIHAKVLTVFWGSWSHYIRVAAAALFSW